MYLFRSLLTVMDWRSSPGLFFFFNSNTRTAKAPLVPLTPLIGTLKVFFINYTPPHNKRWFFVVQSGIIVAVNYNEIENSLHKGRYFPGFAYWDGV